MYCKLYHTLIKNATGFTEFVQENFFNIYNHEFFAIFRRTVTLSLQKKKKQVSVTNFRLFDEVGRESQGRKTRKSDDRKAPSHKEVSKSHCRDRRPRRSVIAKIRYAENKEITPTDYKKSVGGVNFVLFDKLRVFRPAEYVATRRVRPRAISIDRSRTKKKSDDRSHRFSFWSGLRGSNPPPRPWQGRALPNELNPHRWYSYRRRFPHNDTYYTTRASLCQ